MLLIPKLPPVAVFLCLILGWADGAHAQERRETYNGIRALGMGGVSVATVNDETALLLNPAALGRLRDFYGTYFDPEIEINNRVSPMRRQEAFSNPFTIEEIAGVTEQNPQLPYHARMQIFPSFVGRNFGIGLLGRYVLDMERTDANSLDTFYQDDLALFLGYNLRLLGGRLKIGFSGKVISRLELEETLDPTENLGDAALAAAGKLREGVGVGADVGIQLTAPWALLPTVGAVLRDVGGTKFDQMTNFRGPESTERPRPLTQDVDVGVSISPIHANEIRSQWSLEVRGLMSLPDEEDQMKRLHFGGEMNFGDVFFLRIGYHQRYLSAGFELASERFQFQLATYGEEIGTDGSPREDRRHAMKFAFRF